MKSGFGNKFFHLQKPIFLTKYGTVGGEERNDYGTRKMAKYGRGRAIRKNG